MSRICLVHWNGAEGAALAKLLRRAGFLVEHYSDASLILRGIREFPPDVIAIDLSRTPAAGREVGVALRGKKYTRQIPLLFIGGAEEKVALVREKLPDAFYCDENGVEEGIQGCLLGAPENPVVPEQMMERYAKRTTAQKLGIKAGSKVAVRNAPRDYARVIGAVPEGVEFDEEGWQGCAVSVWFVEAPEEMLDGLAEMQRIAAKSKLWVAWPKAAGRKDARLNENTVRELGLGAGLVDYKVCSIDTRWSGLCFAAGK